MNGKTMEFKFIQNDLDQIFDNLYIGGQKAATNKERLKELEIKYILNVTC